MMVQDLMVVDRNMVEALHRVEFAVDNIAFEFEIQLREDNKWDNIQAVVDNIGYFE